VLGGLIGVDDRAADDETGAFLGERFEVGARCSPARTVLEVEQRDVHPARVRTSGADLCRDETNGGFGEV